MGTSPYKSDKKKKQIKAFKHEKVQDIKAAKKKLASNVSSSSWWGNVLKLMLIIVFYFISSIALTFYQKDLIQKLPFPLSIVILHLALKFCLAGLGRYLWSKWNGGKSRITLSWNQYMSRVALVAVVSGLDIGLSQWSLEYITLSLYTMTKTTSTPFILFFGLFFKLERKHWSQIIIVLLISGGLIMFTYKATSFSLIGFSMVLIAAFFSGIRWTLSQLIMQKSKLGLENPVDFIFHIQPLMILSLLPIAIGVEGVEFSASEYAFRFHEFSTFAHTLSLMLFGGLLAFSMEVAEFMVVTFASSLTLAIVGVVKEVTILILAIFRNGNEVTPINFFGMVICLCGIFAHIIRKTLATEEKKSVPKLNLNELSSSSDDDDNGKELFRPRLIPSKTKFDGIPLLDDTDDSDNGLRNTHRKRSGGSTSDDQYFRDNRTWTSTRDRHLEMTGLQSDEELNANEIFVQTESKNQIPVSNLLSD